MMKIPFDSITLKPLLAICFLVRVKCPHDAKNAPASFLIN